MATALTHSLVAGSLAGLGPGGVSRLRLAAALALLGALPDLDVVAFRLDIPYSHPLGHRGFSHSLTFAILAGMAVAILFFRGVRPLSRDWWMLAGLLAVGTASHGILDAFSDAGRGVGFFVPFDDARTFFPWRPLETSPLELERFASRAPAILANEMLWVWLPLGASLALAWVTRLILGRRRHRVDEPS